MNKNLDWRLLIVKSLAVYTALQTVTSASAAPHWEAQPKSDAPTQGLYLGFGLHPTAAKDGVLYEFESDETYGASLCRWTKVSGWQRFVNFTSDPAIVHTMIINGNVLYFGGAFDNLTTISGQSINVHNIAKIDLSSLTVSAVGNGSISGAAPLSGQADEVEAIVLDSQGNVYASLNVWDPSNPNSPYKANAVPIVKCDGTGSWTELGQGLRLGPENYQSYIGQPGVGVKGLATDGTNIFACGRFLGGTNSDSSYVPSAGIIKWNGLNNKWQTMGPTLTTAQGTVGGIYDLRVASDPYFLGFTYFVNAIAVSGTNVFIAGNFVGVDEVGNPAVSSVGQGLARFSTDGQLRQYESLNDEHILSGGWGYDLAVQSDGTVYLAGAFDQIDNTTGLLGIAKWDGTNTWEMLDPANGDLHLSGYDGWDNPSASALAADGTNAVYVYGDFDAAGGIPVSVIDPQPALARWVTGSNPDPYPKITTLVGPPDVGCPLGIAFDANNNLWIADLGRVTIDKFSGGVLTTPLAFNNFSTPCGVALDGNGYLYVADGDYDGIMQFQDLSAPPNFLGGFQLSGAFTTFAPQSLAIDSSSNLYFVDEGQYSWDPNTDSSTATYNIVSEMYPDGTFNIVAGDGTQGYSGDGSALGESLFVDAYYYDTGFLTGTAAVDSQANIYIADIGNNIVREVSGGTMTTIAGNHSLGGGYSGDNDLAVNAQLLRPAAVAVDSLGNVYIADAGNNRIRRVDASTGIITTLVDSTGQAGYFGDNGPAINAKINTPAGLVFDAAGNLYISDMGNAAIRKVQFYP